MPPKMSRKPLRTKTEIARQHLAGTAPTNEDSEDELGIDHQDWEWIYADQVPEETHTPLRKRKALAALSTPAAKRIVGARNRKFECGIGDVLLLKAERNDVWVAIVQEFAEDGEDGTKSAMFMWFISPLEIHNKAKRKTDVMLNELYITKEMDYNPLETIEGKALVVSPERFLQMFPNGKVPKKELAKIFVCRMGCNSKTATYTKEFVWEDVYQGAKDIEPLQQRITHETKATRKRKTPGGKQRDLSDFVTNDEGYDETPRTPSKRRKQDPAGTPKSKPVTRSPRKFTTPTHKRIITKKPLEFTPLGTRILSPTTHLSSPFQLARSHLHVSSVPSALPCRETEFSTVYSYLEAAITDGTGSCIYISGTPGTGKTATVREVIAQLNASVLAEELDDFVFVEINGMKVTDPHQSYSLLWEALTGDRLSSSHALGLLEREFSSPSPRRVPCVVLMDELDQLVTKNQSVMYNFFNWPTFRHSRLIVLAVANTMDLPERTLSNKISSRLGLTRIIFGGYTHEQLIRIIQSRLEGVPGNIVDADAIQFASRKVAQVSGDARRALDICRRAVEIAEAEAKSEPEAPDTPSKKSKVKVNNGTAKGNDKMLGRVTIATVQRAIREATTSPLQQFLRCLPLASKLFLAAMLAQARRTGVAECLLGDVIEGAKRIANMNQLLPVHDFLLCNSGVPGNGESPSKPRSLKSKVPRVLAMGSAAIDLVEAGIVILESRRSERTGKIRLNIAEEEVKLALKDDAEARGLGFAA